MNSITRLAQLRDTQTAYSQYGDAGPPILLIHGAEATRSSFEEISQILCGSMTVYSYDQRQCGETRGGVSPSSVIDLIDDAAQLLEELGLKKLTVLGTSFGGRIAQGLAIYRPQLMERLILCNTWPLDVELEVANVNGVARLHVLRTGLPATARPLAEAYYGADYVARHPDLITRFAQRTGNGSKERTKLVRTTHPLPPQLIAVPTLLISGSEDVVVPMQIMHEMHARIAGSCMVDIQGGHHAITIERAAEVASWVKAFVQREGIAQ